MPRLRKTALGAGVAIAVLLPAPTARAAAPDCPSAAMYVAAHQDDTLLFQSPSLLRDARSGRCVRTVFLTAGDAGKGASYWEGREDGAEAGYAAMLGVADQWTSSQIVADGHSIHLETLKAQPKISIAYMRLPDGEPGGGGSPAYGNESLTKLWKDGNPGEGGPTIDDIEAVDDSEAYDYDELVDSLADLIESFGPTQLATQDYTLNFGEGDHADHVATAYFAAEAAAQYDRSYRLLAYQGYDAADRPQNVFGDLLLDKSAAFYAYGEHDSAACSDAGECAGTDYEKWLLREYVEDTETVGAVAQAGYPQEAGPAALVELDGSESSGESGDPLAYSWVQTGGSKVVLTGAATDSPSFVTPPHPTLLTFSLTVADGSVQSEPDYVKVRVPGSNPTPAAVVGPDQAVDSGATVTLDGSESWDPNSLPLQYVWTQTGGPAVSLQGASSATPSFVAPTGPATVTFSLVVSNGTQVSALQAMTVQVAAPGPTPTPKPTPTNDGPGTTPNPPVAPPPAPASFGVKLSKGKVRLRIGRASRQVIRVLGSPRPFVECRGALPPGASCTVTPERSVVVAGSKAMKKAGTFRLTVQVTDHSGTVQRPLIVQIRRSRGG